MKLVTITLVIAFCSVLVLRGQAADPPQQPSPEEMAKMMAEWEKLNKPGDHHKQLDFFIGKWKCVTKLYFAGPNGPAAESEGSAESKWVLDKRFVQSAFKGSMPMPDPKTGAVKKIPFEGIGTMGYDNARNLHVGTWMDSLSTHISSFKGTMVPGSKTIRMFGEMDEPLLKMYGRTVKYVWRITGKDQYVFEIIDLAAGDDYKVIEITYTRQK